MILVFLLLALALPVKADESTQRIHDKISEQRQALLKTEIEKRGILGALFNINKEIKKKEGDLQSVRGEMQAVQKNIDSYVKIINRIQASLDKQRRKLHDRLRALVKFGYQGYAQVLLSSKSSSELSRNMKFLKIVTEKDRGLISNFRDNLDTLAKQRDGLRNQIKVYAQFDKQLNQEQRRLIEQRNRQMSIMHKIENERESHLMALRELREAGQKLEQRMADIGARPLARESAQTTFFEQKGILKAPVPHEIVQGYGIIHNARFNTSTFHKGVFFAAQSGDDVTAVFNGTIAYAGWLNGYGETLIIDHGDHYYSLYAHNSRLFKEQGETVHMGEKIAAAGDTGSLRGSGLYFELRHFSETLDPTEWLDLPRAKVSQRTTF